jgi:hypothetical protein
MSTAVNAATRSTKTKVANANRVLRARILLEALFGSTLDSITDPILHRKSQDGFCTGETLKPAHGYRVKGFFATIGSHLGLGETPTRFDAGQRPRINFRDHIALLSVRADGEV